jgi:hypothetical protein
MLQSSKFKNYVITASKYVITYFQNLEMFSITPPRCGVTARDFAAKSRHAVGKCSKFGHQAGPASKKDTDHGRD